MGKKLNDEIEKIEEKKYLLEEKIEEDRQHIHMLLEEKHQLEMQRKRTVVEIIKHTFSIKEDVASHAQIYDTMLNAGEVTGTNMCLLVLAILIASIGLNMNSTAAIIGAMLISPLMGTIHASAYGVATVDFEMAKNSFVGLICQVVISLVTSTIYFALTPISATTSELLARTTPTVWDVMIAICGGIAGIIGITRKEKSNVIPGVAIATALMPPLCTCGYSIANGQWRMLFGAFYLFLANTYFIFLSAAIILLILDVPKVKDVDEKKFNRIKMKIVRNTIVMIIPSIIFAIEMINAG